MPNDEGYGAYQAGARESDAGTARVLVEAHLAAVVTATHCTDQDGVLLSSLKPVHLHTPRCSV
jgi:hypothetical protein